MLIKNVFIEGPDCSGKTTVINKIHKHTNYRYHMFDRSRMSKHIFSWLYNRTNKDIDSNLFNEERSDLSNLYIVLLPGIDVVEERFKSRGDEIHDLEGIRRVYQAFEDHVEYSGLFPNVIVIRESDSQWITALGAIENYRKKKEFNVIKHLVHTSLGKESTLVKTSEVGYMADLKKNNECMEFEKEREYYEQIEKDFIQKFIDETSGNNEYNRKEQVDSRRFIYTSDTCISSIHVLVRDNTIHVKAYMRSSNVDQVEHDYNFIKNQIIVFSNLIRGKFSKYCDYYRFDLSFGSAHVIKE